MKPISPIPQNPVSNSFEWREWLTSVFHHIKNDEDKEGLNCSLSYNVTQTFAAANTAYLVLFNSVDAASKFTLVNNAAVAEVAGTYNIQFSIQVENTSTSIETVYIWLRKNGVDVVGTGSKFDVNAKHGSSNGYLVPVANFFVYLAAGDSISLAAAVTNTTVTFEAYSAQTTPWAMPAIPSNVMTVSQVV